MDFNGKPYSFVPGKEAMNKEPGVSKFVVEKLYRVHRERIMKMKPILDTKMHIPSFLTDNTWKEGAALAHKEKIARENEAIYKRIAKRESEDSPFVKTQREHRLRVDDIKVHAKHLKEADRVRQAMRIQKENELLLQRLERARPEYTAKSIKDWYAHHVHFKEGRRSDPTAGHIMHNMGSLLPTPLPSLSGSKSSVYNSALDGSSMFSSESASRISSTFDESEADSVISSMIMATSIIDNTIIAKDKKAWKKKKRKAARETQGEPAPAPPAQAKALAQPSLVSLDPPTASGAKADAGEGLFVEGEFVDVPDTPAIPEHRTPDRLVQLAAREKSAPFDNRLFRLTMLADDPPGDRVHARISESGSSDILYERVISLEKVAKVLQVKRQSFLEAIEDDDGAAIRRAFLREFEKLAVERGQKALGLDELYDILIGGGLGGIISKGDLHYCLAQQSGSEQLEQDGYLVFVTHVLLAAHAKSIGRNSAERYVARVEEKVADSLFANEYDALVGIAMGKFKQQDVLGTGLLHPGDVLDSLQSLTGLGLRQDEIVMLLDEMPSYSSSEKQYENFSSHFRKVRHQCKRNALMKNEATGLYSKLLKRFQMDEINLRKGQGLSEVVTGLVAPAVMRSVLLDFAEPLGVDALDLHVLLSHFFAGPTLSAVKYDYFEFARLAVHACAEITDESIVKIKDAVLGAHSSRPASKLASGKGRLSSSPDLSSSAGRLAVIRKNSMYSEDAGRESEGWKSSVREGLVNLFVSEGVNVAAALSEDRVYIMLKMLGLDLTGGHESDIFSSLLALENGQLGEGLVSFSSLCGYLVDNINHLSRHQLLHDINLTLHKHRSSMRILAETTLHGVTSTGDSVVEDETVNWEEMLTGLFSSLDDDESGLLSSGQIVDVLSKLDLQLSPMEMQLLMSELHEEEGGLVLYRDVLPACAELLHVFDSKHTASSEHHYMEERAMVTARARVLGEDAAAIKTLARFVEDKLVYVHNRFDGEKERLSALSKSFASKHLNMSRREGNALFAALFKHEGLVRYRRFDNSSHSDTVADSGAITSKEIVHAISHVRTAAIAHNIMTASNTSVDAVAEQLMTRFREACQASGAKVAKGRQASIPVRLATQVLESSGHFHLTHPQVVAILSWAECYDASHENLLLPAFAHHAAEVIYTMLRGEGRLEEGASAAADAKTSALQAMNGLTEAALDEYFFALFDAYANSAGEIPSSQFFEIVKNTPKLRLTLREAAAVCSAYVGNRFVNKDDFLPHAYASLLGVAMQRQAGRAFAEHFRRGRHSVADSGETFRAADPEAFVQLTTVCKRFIQYLDISFVGESIVISLPDETIIRRSSLLEVLEKNSTVSAHPSVDPEIITELTSSLRVLPVYHAPPRGQRLSLRPSAMARSLSAMVKVLSVERDVFSDKTLVASYAAVDGSLARQQELLMSLPTSAQVCKATAREFAANLVECMYLLQDAEGGTALHVHDERLADVFM